MNQLPETLISEIAVFVEKYGALERRCKELESSQFNADKFYAVTLPVETVARLHSVSAYLVRKYVKMGYIPSHPSSTDAKILIRASDALLLDFDKMRDAARFANEK